MCVKPIIFWEGFPACGLLLKQVVQLYPNLIICATKPNVPFNNLEERLGVKIYWLDHAFDIWTRREEFSDRNLVIFTGWWNKGWIKYANLMRTRNNAKRVVVVDNNFQLSLRQIFGSVYFRLFLKRNFDAAFVPGHEGVKLMRFLGMPKSQIFTGNYGAFEGIYYEQKPIQHRKKQFLFVGQLVERKNIIMMVDSFLKYRKEGGQWSLRIVGDGPLRNYCIGAGIHCESFAQPDEIREIMNESRVLLLASRQEHWGTVVCEAAACGMALITSKSVGSSVDIVKHNVNGVELPRLNVEYLTKYFHHFESLSQDDLINMSNVSKGIALSFNSFAYKMSFNNLVQLWEDDCDSSQ